MPISAAKVEDAALALCLLGSELLLNYHDGRRENGFCSCCNDSTTPLMPCLRAHQFVHRPMPYSFSDIALLRRLSLQLSCLNDSELARTFLAT